MKKFLLLSGFALTLSLGFALVKESRATDRKPANVTVAFSDGTKIEEVEVATDAIAMYQIKQPDGRTCYGIAYGGDGNHGTSSNISCLSK